MKGRQEDDTFERYGWAADLKENRQTFLKELKTSCLKVIQNQNHWRFLAEYIDQDKRKALKVQNSRRKTSGL